MITCITDDYQIQYRNRELKPSILYTLYNTNIKNQSSKKCLTTFSKSKFKPQSLFFFVLFLLNYKVVSNKIYEAAVNYKDWYDSKARMGIKLEEENIKNNSPNLRCCFQKKLI